MTQFYARENESLRAKIASLESAAAATGSTTSELDETLRKRLQDAERRASDAEAQMTGMERAHLNALTRLETAGREAAAAAAEEHEKLANDLERIRSELLETTRAKETAEREAADARRDAASSAAAARSALAASAATSLPGSPAREGEALVSDRDRPLSSPSPSSSSSRRVSSRRPRSVHQSLPSSDSLQAARLAGERVRKRREAEARRAAEEASSRAREQMDKKDAELAELRELVAKLRGDASEAQRERSKAEAKAWEWRRALRASEKAAKDAAGLLRRRGEEQTDERRENEGAEKTPAEASGRTTWVPPGRASVTSPRRTPPRASPRSSTRSVLSTPPSASRRERAGIGGGDCGGRRRQRQRGRPGGHAPHGRPGLAGRRHQRIHRWHQISGRGSDAVAAAARYRQ